MTSAEAYKEGRALLKRMEGRGWKLHVWENLGYHYLVRAPYISVHTGGKGYFAMIGREKFAIGTPVEWHNDQTFKDPNRAVRAAIAKIKKVVLGDVAVMTKIIAAIGA